MYVARGGRNTIQMKVPTRDEVQSERKVFMLVKGALYREIRCGMVSCEWNSASDKKRTLAVVLNNQPRYFVLF